MNAAIKRRFWSKVTKSDGCWIWKTPGVGGYGAFNVAGKSYRAHRLAWEWRFGPIREGLYVCHSCDTPPCVRPDHLFLGTAADNAADRDNKGRGMKGVSAEALRRAKALVPDRPCVSLDEAAALLGLTRQQVDARIRGGELLRNPWNPALIATCEVVRALADDMPEVMRTERAMRRVLADLPLFAEAQP